MELSRFFFFFFSLNWLGQGAIDMWNLGNYLLSNISFMYLGGWIEAEEKLNYTYNFSWFGVAFWWCHVPFF